MKNSLSRERLNDKLPVAHKLEAEPESLTGQLPAAYYEDTRLLVPQQQSFLLIQRLVEEKGSALLAVSL